MATACYIVPAAQVTRGKKTFIEPACLDIAHGLPGYVQARGNQKGGVYFFTVEAASFAALDVLSSVKKVGQGATDFQALTIANPGILAQLQQYEPSAKADIYDRVTPQPNGTITDNFNRASLGTGWTANGGTWDIYNSEYLELATTYQTHTIVRSEAAGFPNDQWAQFDIQKNDTNGQWEGVVVRCTSDSSYYDAQLVPGVESIYCYGPGGYLADHAETVGNDTFHTVKIDDTGTAITIWFDGASAISTSDGTLASGRPGAIGYKNAGAVYLDNFQCIDASGGGGGFTAVNRRTLGPRVGSRSIY